MNLAVFITCYIYITRPDTNRNFTAEHENMQVPKLQQCVQHWTRYVDDTFVYVKDGSRDLYVLSVLETLYPNIKFTYEKEVTNTLPFLDVLFIRNSGRFIKLYIEKKPTIIYT